MRFRWIVLLVVGAVALGYGAVQWLAPSSPFRESECTATVGTLSATVDLEQARWAALMAAIAEQRGLPARATTIAIAAAFQESKLHNIDYGDRDSVGLFQQRPSQGWGTREQIMQPAYAIGSFYDHLVQVDGYESMQITVAAQKVQRSGYPDAYAAHEPQARALASALRGQSSASFTCYYTGKGGGDTVADRLREGFGSSLTVATGNRIAVDSSTVGWTVAHFLVANAAGTGVRQVTYAGHAWTPAKGWRSTDQETSRRSVTYRATKASTAT